MLRKNGNKVTLRSALKRVRELAKDNENLSRILAVLVARETERNGRCVLEEEELRKTRDLEGVRFEISENRVVCTTVAKEVLT